MSKPFVKICGITNYPDANKVCECGSDALGFIAYNKSKRFISYERVKDISEKLNRDYPDVFRVGVFVNESIEGILNYIVSGINVIQLHGDEDNSFISELRVTLRSNAICCEGRPVEIWKALRLKDSDEIKFASGIHVDKVLIDTFSKDEYGGTGKTGDWELAGCAVKNIKRPVILAGGLCPANIALAIEKVRPFGIDISSGVEKQPGIKDHELITEVFDKLNTIA